MALSGEIDATYSAIELVTMALRDIGYIGRSETPDSDDALEAYRILNQMIKTWQMEGANLWTGVDGTPIPLISGQATYTLTPRPRTVANMRRQTVGALNEEFPMTPFPKQDYDRFPSKNSPGAPIRYMITRGRTATTVTFWPVPNQTGRWTVPYSYERNWEMITSGEQDVDIPQEGFEAVLYNFKDRLIENFRVPVTDHNKRIMERAPVLKQAFMNFDRQDSVRFVRG